MILTNCQAIAAIISFSSSPRQCINNNGTTTLFRRYIAHMRNAITVSNGLLKSTTNAYNIFQETKNIQQILFARGIGTNEKHALLQSHINKRKIAPIFQVKFPRIASELQSSLLNIICFFFSSGFKKKKKKVYHSGNGLSRKRKRKSRNYAITAAPRVFRFRQCGLNLGT